MVGAVATTAPYDEIADWYESVFLAAQRANPSEDGFADRIGVDRAVTERLGEGAGLCLEIGCGTGIYASLVRRLGWTPLGITCRPACCDTRRHGFP